MRPVTPTPRPPAAPGRWTPPPPKSSHASQTPRSQRAPTTKYGAASSIEADGIEPTNRDKDIYAPIKWEFSVVPAGSKVRSDSVTLNVANATKVTYQVYGLKRAWVGGASSHLAAVRRKKSLGGGGGQGLAGQGGAIGGCGQRTCALHPEQHKMACHEPKVLVPVGVGLENVDTGTYLGEGRSNILFAPNRALTRSFYLFSEPTKGGRKRSSAQRGGCFVPTWPRGPLP
jgi:hypothetical protein